MKRESKKVNTIGFKPYNSKIKLVDSIKNTCDDGKITANFAEIEDTEAYQIDIEFKDNSFVITRPESESQDHPGIQMATAEEVADIL